MINAEWIAGFGYSIIKLSTPLIFAALGGILTSKAGMFNIALEGMMLVAALVGVVFANVASNLWVGLLAAVLAGVLAGAVIAYCHIIAKTELYLTCIALNLAATGGTVFAMFLLTGDKSNTMATLKAYEIPKITLPLINKIPIIGDMISGHSLLTYFAVFAAFLVWFLLYKSRLGLRIRSVGENPHAAESVGISTKKIRFTSFLLSGVMCGLSGAFMSMSYVTFFGKAMVAGRGYIGLAAMNIAAESPVGSMIAALFFGSMDTLSVSLQNSKIPVEFVKMVPYLATIIGLVIINLMRISHLKRIEKGKLESKA